MNRKWITFILFVFLSLNSLIAQNLTVKGTITDEKTGESLIGASVLQKGTSNGTITNFDGNFTISVPTNATLVISYVGYLPQEVVVKSNEAITVKLYVDDKTLEEVVVVGYGTARKRDLTGAITSLSGDDIKNAPNNNPINALQGKVPGLSITNSGSAGSSPKIQLRGVATMNSGTQPIYVVDGMILNNIDFLSPQDIESIEVLRDPSSLAIFGVQGANGVIIVTTKRADKNKLTLNYDGYVGSQILHDRDRVKLTNASEFTELYNELLTNMNPSASAWVPDLLGGGTDWMSQVLRPATITNHSISISQSTDKSSTVMSLGYFAQDGIVKYNSYKRLNGRLASDFNLGKYFKTGASINFSRWDVDPATASIQNAVQAIPTYSPYSPETDHNPENIGSYYTPSPGIQKDVANPVALMEIGKGNSESYGYRTTANLYGEIKFLKDFTFKATGYADIGINLGSVFTPRFDVNNSTSNSSHKSDKTSFKRSVGEYKNYQADFLLNYNKVLDLHRIGGMVGYTVAETTEQGFDAASDSILNGSAWIVPQDFWLIRSGSDQKRYASDWDRSKAMISYISRGTYSYADKYLLTTTLRLDGSSQFKSKNRWKLFPSLGLGWVASEEDFFKPLSKKIDFLKIKAAWGKLGNDKIWDANLGNYLQYPTINPKGEQVVVNGQVYYLPTTEYDVDEDLTWEVVSGFDVGFDSKMFNNRLSFDFGYYNKTTDGLLVRLEYEAVNSGLLMTNAGSINNQGVECVLSWHDKIGDFGYTISANGSTVKNKITSLGAENADVITGLYHKSRVGYSVGSIFGYEQVGIFQNQQEIDNAATTSWISKPGDIQYKDITGDGKITDKDRSFIGSTIPSFLFGLNLAANYKGFDMSVEFNGIAGSKIINTKKLPSFTQFNFYEEALTRWHGEGTSNNYPILDNTRSHNFLPSTNLLEDGSYVRLRNLQIGYTLPKSVYSILGVSKVRIYANAQNLLTFKSNSGFTPEIGGGILSANIDNGSTYPLPTTYTCGLSVNF